MQRSAIKKNNDIILPCKNESLHIRTQSQLNAMTIFDSILKKHNKIKFLIIQSYTIDDKSIQKLYDNIKNGKIETLQIILTETLSFRSPSHYKKIKDIFINEKNVNLVFYWIHSKVHLVETESDKYVVDGSGNFSMNAQIEHYNIFNSDELFDFDYKWQNDFFFGEKLRKNHEIYKNF